jgi:serine/threonine protein kinase
MLKPIEVRLVGRFKFDSKVEGDHEAILYNAIHSQTNEDIFLKGEENRNPKMKKGLLSILQEGKIYQSMQGGIGIPYMHWCGQEEDYNFIALEGLSLTFSKLLSKCGNRFSLKTSLSIGMELISILQYYHFKHFTYNNLCPKHVMIGKGEKCDKIFIIDFSRAHKFRDSNTQEHI